MKRTIVLNSIFLVLAMGLFRIAFGQTPSGANQSSGTVRDSGAAGADETLETFLAHSRKSGRGLFGDRQIPKTSTASTTGPALPVAGSGSVGYVTMFSGENSSWFISDSNIFQSKYGEVGIGTTSPSSTLTIAGTVESTSGGFLFPDGTLQTTAGLSTVSHDATLTGSGSGGAPLGISIGGVGTNQLANGTAVRGISLGSGTNATDFIRLTPGANISLSGVISLMPGGLSTITIAAPNVLTQIAHDSTLTGDGTAAAPLSVLGAGATIAYSGDTSTAVGTCLALDGAGMDIATKMVPAGSYLIFSTVNVANLDKGGPQTASCTISSPDNPSFVSNIGLVRLPQNAVSGFASGCGDIRQGQGTINQQTVVTLTVPTTISLHCNGSNIQSAGGILTAIKVGSVQ